MQRHRHHAMPKFDGVDKFQFNNLNLPCATPKTGINYTLDFAPKIGAWNVRTGVVFKNYRHCLPRARSIHKRTLFHHPHKFDPNLTPSSTLCHAKTAFLLTPLYLVSKKWVPPPPSCVMSFMNVPLCITTTLNASSERS